VVEEVKVLLLLFKLVFQEDQGVVLMDQMSLVELVMLGDIQL
tara:strand:- start:290 stop:415 length:126 start_codon:yes stop_codon:yes gene_type:complete